MSISRGRMNTTQGPHAGLVVNSLISSLSLLVKSFEVEIQLFGDYVDTIRGINTRIASITPYKRTL